MKYHIIRFSPQPEHIDFVNVAILTTKILYKPDFSKLKPIAPNFPPQLLASYFDKINLLEEKTLENNAQIQISEPKIFEGTETELLNWLLDER